MADQQQTTPNISWRPGRYGRKKPPKKNDTSFVAKAERAVSVAANNTATTADNIGRNIGERPFGTQKLTERQQVRRYSLVRDDPQMWTQLLQQHALKDVVEYALRMETLCQKYPEDANYVNPKPKIEE